MKLVTIIVAIACLTLAAVAIAQHAPALVGEQKPSRPMEVDAAVAIPQPNPDTRAADAPRTLTIGDPAPKPQLARIFKGATDFKGPTPGKVTVMEFWATWCGPCKAGMPHLSELQEKYASKGVNIVGVTREKPEVVEAFLAQKQWDEKTRYTIALDLEDATSKAYMTAAKRNGIPCAFVVDGEGKIAWIGHPMSMDEPLDEIVAGTWDRKAFATEYENSQKAARIMAAVRQERRNAQRSGDYRGMMKTLDAAIEEMPEDTGLQMMKFQTMIGPMNDGEGYDLGWKLLKRNRDDAMMLNSMAWYTLDDPTVGERDFEFAMAAAKAANTAAGGNDPAILDTLARAYYEQGDLDMAIKIQRKAVEKSDGGPMAEGIETQLQKYRDEASSGRKAG